MFNRYTYILLSLGLIINIARMPHMIAMDQSDAELLSSDASDADDDSNGTTPALRAPRKRTSSTQRTSPQVRHRSRTSAPSTASTASSKKQTEVAQDDSRDEDTSRNSHSGSRFKPRTLLLIAAVTTGAALLAKVAQCSYDVPLSLGSCDAYHYWYNYFAGILGSMVAGLSLPEARQKVTEFVQWASSKMGYPLPGVHAAGIVDPLAGADPSRAPIGLIGWHDTAPAGSGIDLSLLGLDRHPQQSFTNASSVVLQAIKAQFGQCFPGDSRD